MTLRATEVRALIGSLDLITNNEPPNRWKSTCDNLLSEYAKGHELRRLLLPAAPVTAIAAYLAFEVRALDDRGLILIAIALVGTGAYFFAPMPPTLSLTGLMVILLGLALVHFAHLQYYWLLAVAIGLLIHLVASRLYPALQFEHRIRALLAYFGYPIQDVSRSKLSFHDYP
jgi:hypothetical protein